MAEEARVRYARTAAPHSTRPKKTQGCRRIDRGRYADVEDQVQKLTDRFVKSIDDHLKHKEAEVMKV